MASALRGSHGAGCSKRADRDFLGSLGAKGQSPDINERLALADFYFFLSVDPTQKENWRLFREHLQQEADNLQEAKARVATEEAKNEPDFIALARAQSDLVSLKARSLISTQQSAPEPVDTKEQSFGALVSDLLAEDAGTRRSARSALASLGPGLLRPAMDVLNHPRPYRIKLGLVVAITEMMRENMGSRERMISELTAADLEILVKLAGNSDRTIRIYAREFLFDLGDPRVLDIAIDLFSNLSDNNARYNLVLIMKGASPYVTAANAPMVRDALKTMLRKVGPKTDALIKQAIDRLPPKNG